MHGKGTFSWKDGRKYEGDYVQDKKEGQGTFTWPNGKVYEGGWMDGKQHGDGKLINTNTGDTLEGRWVNGTRVKN